METRPVDIVIRLRNEAAAQLRTLEQQLSAFGRTVQTQSQQMQAAVARTGPGARTAPGLGAAPAVAGVQASTAAMQALERQTVATTQATQQFRQTAAHTGTALQSQVTALQSQATQARFAAAATREHVQAQRLQTQAQVQPLNQQALALATQAREAQNAARALREQAQAARATGQAQLAQQLTAQSQALARQAREATAAAQALRGQAQAARLTTQGTVTPLQQQALALRQVTREAQAAAQALRAQGAEVVPLTSRIATFGATLRTALGAAGIVVGLQGIAQAMRSTVGSLLSFDTALAKAGARGGVAAKDLAAFRAQLIALDPMLGKTTDLANALGEALSVGVDPGQAVAFIAQAARAAQANYADLTTVVRGLTQVMTSFGIPLQNNAQLMQQSAQTLDILAKAMEVGRAEFGQLFDAFGVVAPLAGQFKLSIAETAGVLATLTTTLGNSERAATAMNSLLNSVRLNMDKWKAAGIDVQQVLGTSGLLGLMQELRRVTGGSAEQISTFVTDVQGVQAAVALMGPVFQTATRNVAAVGNAVGDTGRKFQDFTQTAGAQTQALGQQWDRLVQENGADLLSFLADLATVIRTTLPAAIATVRLSFATLLEWFARVDRTIRQFTLDLATSLDTVRKGFIDFHNFIANSPLGSGETLTFKVGANVEALQAGVAEAKRTIEEAEGYKREVLAETEKREQAAADAANKAIQATGEQRRMQVEIVKQGTQATAQQASVLQKAAQAADQLDASLARAGVDSIARLQERLAGLRQRYGALVDQLKQLTPEQAARRTQIEGELRATQQQITQIEQTITTQEKATKATEDAAKAETARYERLLQTREALTADIIALRDGEDAAERWRDAREAMTEAARAAANATLGGVEALRAEKRALEEQARVTEAFLAIRERATEESIKQDEELLEEGKRTIETLEEEVLRTQNRLDELWERERTRQRERATPEQRPRIEALQAAQVPPSVQRAKDEYVRQFDAIVRLNAELAHTPDLYTDWARAQDGVSEANRRVLSVMDQTLEKLAQQRDLQRELEQTVISSVTTMGEAIESNLWTAIEGIALEGQKVGETFEAFGLAILKTWGQTMIDIAFKPVQLFLEEWAKQLAQSELIQKLVGIVVGAVAGAAGGAATPATMSNIGTLPFGVHGGIYSTPRRAQFGELFTAPRYRVLGEATPEAAVPLTEEGIGRFTRGLSRGQPASQDTPLTAKDLAQFEKVLASRPINVTIALEQKGMIDPKRLGLQEADIVRVVGKNINDDGVIRRVIVSKTGKR